LTKLAAETGTPYGTLYGYARGEREMPEEFLRKVAKVLQKSEAELLSVEEVLNDRPTTAYGENSILKALGDDELKRIFKAKCAEIDGATGDRSIVLLVAIEQMAREMARREREK